MVKKIVLFMHEMNGMNMLACNLHLSIFPKYAKEEMKFFHFFFSFGVHIGKRPWLTIILSVLLCFVCSAGNVFWQVNTDNDALWTPYGSPVSLITILLMLLLSSEQPDPQATVGPVRQNLNRARTAFLNFLFQ